MFAIRSGFRKEYLNFLLMVTPISKVTSVSKIPNRGELMMAFIFAPRLPCYGMLGRRGVLRAGPNFRGIPVYG